MAERPLRGHGASTTMPARSAWDPCGHPLRNFFGSRFCPRPQENHDQISQTRSALLSRSVGGVNQNGKLGTVQRLTYAVKYKKPAQQYIGRVIE
jgi:hypothetical protein